MIWGAQEVGPIDLEVARPVRSALLTNCTMLGLLCALFVGIAVWFAPQIANAVGVSQSIQATVVSVQPPQGSKTKTGKNCDTNVITYRWGDGHTGTARRCQFASGANPKVDGTVTIHVLPGWHRVVPDGGRFGSLALTLFVLVGLCPSGWFAVSSWRQVRALDRASARSVASPAIPAHKDKLGSSTGRRSFARMSFPGTGFKPCRLAVHTGNVPTIGGMGWNNAQVRPLGRTMRGRPAGPYLIHPADGMYAEPLVATGRPLRRAR